MRVPVGLGGAAMLIMGYRITDKAMRAGLAAIKARRRSFCATQIAREIQPFIRENKGAWRGMAVSAAAVGAAEALIWEQFRAGAVKPAGRWLSRQYWRATEPKSIRIPR